VAEEEEKIEVEITDERVVPLFRGELPPDYQFIVTYRHGLAPQRTLFLLASEIAKDQEEELKQQFEAREGPLWESYVAARARAIREDIEALRVRVPRRITV